VRKPGGNTALLAVAAALHLVDQFLPRVPVQDVFQVAVVVGAGGGHLHDRGTGGVDQVVDLALALVSDLCDPGTDLDQATQHRAVGDDLGVVPGVGGRGDRLGEGVQVWGPAHPGGLATFGQFIGYRDGVDGLVVVGQVADGLVDDLVGGPVKVGRPGEDALDVGQQQFLGGGVRGGHQAAEGGLFGGDVVWWDSVVHSLVSPSFGWAGRLAWPQRPAL